MKLSIHSRPQRIAWRVLILGACILALFAIFKVDAQEPGGVPTIMQGEPYALTWEQEPFCTDGTAITECPVTGYHVQIQREQSSTSWNNVRTTAFAADVRTWTWVANGTGLTCFRVNVLNSAAYEASPPSNERCVKVLAPLRPGTRPPILTSSKDQTQP